MLRLPSLVVKLYLLTFRQVSKAASTTATTTSTKAMTSSPSLTTTGYFPGFKQLPLSLSLGPSPCLSMCRPSISEGKVHSMVLQPCPCTAPQGNLLSFSLAGAFHKISWTRVDFVKPDVLASGRLLTNMTSQVRKMHSNACHASTDYLLFENDLSMFTLKAISSTSNSTEDTMVTTVTTAGSLSTNTTMSLNGSYTGPAKYPRFLIHFSEMYFCASHFSIVLLSGTGPDIKSSLLTEVSTFYLKM